MRDTQCVLFQVLKRGSLATTIRVMKPHIDDLYKFSSKTPHTHSCKSWQAYPFFWIVLASSSTNNHGIITHYSSFYFKTHKTLAYSWIKSHW